MALDTFVKNQYRLFMISTITLSIGGCFATHAHQDQTLEPLHGITLTDHSIRFTVTGSGCTRVEHFDILVRKGHIPQLLIVRKKHDNCRRKRQAIEIDYPLSMVDINSANSFILGNPLKPFLKQTFK
jgi:hypothetical protein